MAEKKIRSAIGPCLSIAALLAAAGIAAAIFPTMPLRGLVQTVSTFAALAAVVAARVLYSIKLIPSIDDLGRFCTAAKESMSTLTAAIARLSTGDLTASVALPKLPKGLRAQSSFPELSKAMDGLAEAVKQSFDGFDEITNEPCLRAFYVGSDTFEEGLAAGEAIGRLVGKGRVCAIIGDYSSVVYKLRVKGVAARLAEKYPEISVIETEECYESGEKVYAAVLDFIKKHRGLECVYVAEGSTPQFAAKAVVDSGRAGKTIVVAHDTTDATMKYVSSGVIGATISQDPYAQGHDSAVRLYNYIAAGWRPTLPRLLTHLETVTIDNFRSFWDPVSGSVYLDRSNLASILESKTKAEPETIRIAVVCTSGSGFWEPVRQGALDAKKELAARGAVVEWVTPPPELENNHSASVFSPIVERLIAEGYKGIAIPIFERGIIPCLNKAVRAGLVVGTFNSEPVSLREMVSAVRTHTESLIGLSQELAASAEESGRSTERIGETMDKIGAGIDSQLEEVSRTGEELQTLVSDIRTVNKTTEESAASAREVAESSAKGFKSVSEMRMTVQSLEEASSLAEAAIASLEHDTAEIGTISAAIADIANRTNVLAINASIQAARAGERGKGFAVIASEIRKLADQSSQSTKEIARLISQIGERVAAASEATRRGLERAKENSAYAEMSEKSLRDISMLAADNEQRMEVIRTALGDMTKFSSRIEETVRALSDINRANEDASIEVRSSTKEMSAQAADVASTAQALSQMAKDQQVILSQFRIDKEA